MKYAENEVIRTLLQLVPHGIGSAIDTFLTIRLSKLRSQRRRTFFEEIASGNRQLTLETIDSDDFLHAFFITYEAAIKSHRAEKIRLFARMLKNATFNDWLHNVDEYEEYLHILDELSLREIGILTALDRHSISTGESPNPRVKDWKSFFEEIEAEYHIDELECIALLARLNRTGCYETGNVQSSRVFRPGKLTPIWVKLLPRPHDSLH